MTHNENDRTDAHPEDRRRKVDRRTSALVAEEMTLHALRQACGMTPIMLAKGLGVAPKEISEIEKRADMHVSTLRRLVEALGGRLSLIAEFPDRPPVALSGITSTKAKALTQVL